MIPSDFQRYLRSNDFKSLLQRVQKALEGDSGEFFDADDLVDVAEYFHVHGNEEMVGKVTDYLLSLYPDNEKGLVLKTRMLLIAGKLEDAEHLLSSLSDSELVDVTYLNAELMLARDKSDEANDYLLSKCPEYAVPDVENTRVDEMSDLFEDDEDEDDDVEPSPSELYNDYVLDVALLMCDYRQWVLAEEWLGRVSDPSYREEGDYMEVKARMYTGMGETGKAIDYWNRYIDLDAYSLMAWVQLAQCQYMQG